MSQLSDLGFDKFLYRDTIDSAFYKLMHPFGEFAKSDVNQLFNAGTIETTTLTGIIGLNNTNIAAQSWYQTCLFSAYNATAVQWTAGIFESASGVIYNISAGNTGAMTAKTYIYLDTKVSTTEYQVTDVFANSNGPDKVLVTTAMPGTVDPSYVVAGGVGGFMIDSTNIITGSIFNTSSYTVATLPVIAAFNNPSAYE